MDKFMKYFIVLMAIFLNVHGRLRTLAYLLYCEVVYNDKDYRYIAICLSDLAEVAFPLATIYGFYWIYKTLWGNKPSSFAI